MIPGFVGYVPSMAGALYSGQKFRWNDKDAWLEVFDGQLFARDVGDGMRNQVFPCIPVQLVWMPALNAPWRLRNFGKT